MIHLLNNIYGIKISKDDDAHEDYYKYLPEFGYRIVGTVTKDECEAPVFSLPEFDTPKGMMEVQSITHQLNARKRRVYSLIESKEIYFVNPKGDEPPDVETPFNSKYYEWEQYDNKLVEKLLIIEKIKNERY